MKCKKIVSLLLILLILLSTTYSATVLAAELSKSDFEYVMLENNTCEIVKYNGKDTSVSIPNELDGKAVSSIGSRAFEYNMNIQKITIPEGVTQIGERVFNDCVKLVSVEFPKSIKSIGKEAFFSCVRLDGVQLPNGIEVLGDGAFYDCRSISAISLPGSLTSIGKYVFADNFALKNAILNEGISSVVVQMFFGCEQLENVHLPETLKEINRRAFYACTNLKSINFPNSIELIDDSALHNCYEISQNLNLPNLKKLGSKFAVGTKINEISIGSNIEEISPYSFVGSGKVKLSIGENQKYSVENNVLFNKEKTELIAFLNYSLVDYNVPNTVEKINDYAFAHKESLTEVGIPNSVKSIGKNAFEGCIALKEITIPSSVNTIEENTFKECGALETATIENGVTTIKKVAFSGCGSLNAVYIPNTVTDLNYGMFADVFGLDFIKLSADSNFIVEDGVLYSKDKSVLYMYSSNKDNETFTVPNGVKELADYAFAYNNSITKITVPDSLETFGEYSFGICISSGTMYRFGGYIIGSKNSRAHSYAVNNDVPFFTDIPSLNSEKIELKSGETFGLKVLNSIEGDVVYNTSDSRIATVDNNGTITAVGKGDTKIVATVGEKSFVCDVTVTNGALGQSQTDMFKAVAYKESEKWQKDYLAYNSGCSFDKFDVPSIQKYSTNAYTAIVACQMDGAYREQTEEEFGKDYMQYNTVSENLSKELSMYKLNSNIRLYSGKSDVAIYSGTNSSVKALKSAVGNVSNTKSVISTTLSFSISTGFARGVYPTVLEFLAPKDGTRGAYIQPMSAFSREYELLLDKNIKFEVVDGGVKNFNYISYPSGNSDIGGGSAEVTDREDNMLQRFITLKIIPDNNSAENTNQTVTVPPTNSSGSIPTGFSTNMVFVLIGLGVIVVLSACAFFVFRKKSSY